MKCANNQNDVGDGRIFVKNKFRKLKTQVYLILYKIMVYYNIILFH